MRLGPIWNYFIFEITCFLVTDSKFIANSVSLQDGSVIFMNGILLDRQIISPHFSSRAENLWEILIEGERLKKLQFFERVSIPHPNETQKKIDKKHSWI